MTGCPYDVAVSKPSCARAATGALVLLLALGACSNEAPSPSPTPSATTAPAVDDEQAALEAFHAYWDEKVAIAAAGSVPDDALADTAIGALREDEVARLTKDSEQGVVRTGEPEFKQEKVAIDGDSATVTVCINEDDWKYVVGGETVPNDFGWKPLGRTLSKVDGRWLVEDYVEPGDDAECAS
jgi:hypothetical protein